MVKVIIQTEDGTQVLEGELFFGAVITDQGDRYAVTECLRGKMKSSEFPRIIAKTAVSMVKHVCASGEMAQMAALLELNNEITEAADKELSRKLTPGGADAVFAAMKQALDESMKGEGRKSDK